MTACDARCAWRTGSLWTAWLPAPFWMWGSHRLLPRVPSQRARSGRCLVAHLCAAGQGPGLVVRVAGHQKYDLVRWRAGRGGQYRARPRWARGPLADRAACVDTALPAPMPA